MTQTFVNFGYCGNNSATSTRYSFALCVRLRLPPLRKRFGVDRRSYAEQGFTKRECDMSNPLELRFHEAMLDIYRKAKSEAKYNAIRFLQMVKYHGRLRTAHM